MKKMNTERIFFTGSHFVRTRLVYERDGRYYIRWYGNWIEVSNPNGYVTAGWKTVQPY